MKWHLDNDNSEHYLLAWEESYYGEENLKKQAEKSVQNQPDPWQS